MWFLNSLPENVTTNFLVESFGKGYQKTSIHFRVNSEEVSGNTETNTNTQVNVVLPFPWSSNKKDGSLQIIEDDGLDSLLHLENSTRLTENDIQIFENPRKLKKLERDQLDIPTANELWNIYTEEDFGMMLFTIEKDVDYRLDFTHKISIFSNLFVQSRFSNLNTLKGVKCDLNIWSINSRRDALPKFMKIQMSEKDLLKYSFEEFDHSEDIRIPTYNWESSDEESSEEN